MISAELDAAFCRCIKSDCDSGRKVDHVEGVHVALVVCHWLRQVSRIDLGSQFCGNLRVGDCTCSWTRTHGRRDSEFSVKRPMSDILIAARCRRSRSL